MAKDTHESLKKTDRFIYLSNIQWDTSDPEFDEFEKEEEYSLNLPSSVTYKINDLLYARESLFSIDEDELEERAIDKLCSDYGFCIYGCSISYSR